MPHARELKQRTRRRILDAAAQLFVAKGFQATSIEEIMRACDLTRGGFYAHFDSKAQLYQEAIATLQRIDATTVDDANDAEDWLAFLFATCGRDQTLTKEDASPWAFLARDIGSSDPAVRQSYSVALEMLSRKLQSQSADSGQDAESSLATTAMLIGALAISLSVDDARLKMSIATACRSAVRKLYRDEPMNFFWAQSHIGRHDTTTR